MPMNKHTSRLFGFTLLELLVVISIIGILIAISVPTFATAQRQSRNAARMGDLKAVQNCLEQHYVANASSYATGAACVTTTDPKPNTSKPYVLTAADTTYTFCVYLEDVGTGTQGADAEHTKCVTQLQ